MDDELIDTMTKLLNHDREKIKSLGNSNIILQYNNSICQITCDALLKIVDNKETQRLCMEFSECTTNDYILAAYHDGNVIGTKITIP